MTKQQVRIFTSQVGEADLVVTFEQDTVWLSQVQMAELFGKDVRTVNEHIGNVYAGGELERETTIRKFRIVRAEGNREIRRQIEHYNLDVITSVGYRVISLRGVQFRKWATQVLKDYLVQGYSFNPRRLEERGIEFEQTVALLRQALIYQRLVSPEGEAVARVISEYSRSWSLLQGYDEQQIAEIAIRQEGMLSLTHSETLDAIGELGRILIQKGEATSLFGEVHGYGLESALASLEQSFAGELLYPNIASRAAHLLYFVIKNHLLVEGNKRCGSFLFLWYLQRNAFLLERPVELLINDITLVALAPLEAESQPAQKALMIRLIVHLSCCQSQPYEKG